MNRPYCEDCGLFFQNETSFNLHMGGKVHAKQLRKNADLIKRGLQPDSVFCKDLQAAIRASVPVVTAAVQRPILPTIKAPVLPNVTTPTPLVSSKSIVNPTQIISSTVIPDQLVTSTVIPTRIVSSTPIVPSVININCTVCQKMFKNNEYLKVHMANKHDVKHKKTCSICQREFQDNTHLKRHKVLVHTPTDGKYQCKVCPQKFATLKQLRLHNNDHLNWRCEPCNKNFKSLFLLNKHKELHRNERQCQTCNQKFLYLIDFKKHVALHKREDRAAAAAMRTNKKTMDKPLSPRSVSCFNCDKVFSSR